MMRISNRKTQFGLKKAASNTSLILTSYLALRDDGSTGSREDDVWFGLREVVLPSARICACVCAWELGFYLSGLLDGGFWVDGLRLIVQRNGCGLLLGVVDFGRSLAICV